MEDSSSPNHSSSSPMELCQAALQLVCWREPRKSLAAFVSSLTVLVAMATLSVISVVSYLLLACLCVTITFRSQLDRDISVSPESAQQLAERCRNRLNWLSVQTRRLLLVEDLVDSLKMAAIMWLMTYVGALFNGVTILILADVVFFTAPPIYQKKKTQIDRQLVLLRSKLEKVLLRLQDRLPGAVRRSKAE
ncbi:reticulon-3-like isoform X2 [Xiphophorus hellerii]|uniref:reticulon-3-like isoform X2 n=1 Tax=Xiphophorus hellerii TaxID=8084 RepID=UPI0013B3CD90|nr:reticulon-3-like isoform X2 [Xiphophorus hellerii]